MLGLDLLVTEDDEADTGLIFATNFAESFSAIILSLAVWSVTVFECLKMLIISPIGVMPI